METNNNRISRLSARINFIANMCNVVRSVKIMYYFFYLKCFKIFYLCYRYGRRPILIITLLLGGTAGLIKSFSTSYLMFAVMEFVTSLLSSGTYMTAFIMSIEMSGPNNRVFGGSLISGFYSASQVLAGILAMYIHNFRTLLQVMFSPIIILFFYAWMIPESMRWLISNGKLAEARKIILKAAKTNNVTLSDTTLQSLYENNPLMPYSELTKLKENGIQPECNGTPRVRESYSLTIAMKSRVMISRLINCLFCWFTNSLIYFGMNVNSVELAGNKYLNYILVNLVELPTVMFANQLMNRFGRKFTLITSMIVSGVACVSSELVPQDAAVARLILFIIGKCGVTVSFTILYFYTSELFPTCLRHSFLNACSTSGSLGSIIAPQTPLLVSIFKLNYFNE